jgi:hypothetical protein
MTTLRQAAEMAREALETVTKHFTRVPSTLTDTESRGVAHAAIAALDAALEQEPEVRTDFIQHHVEDAGDWSDWVDPKQDEYLIACCDCGLVHEMQFRVAKFESDTSNECEVIEDNNIHAQFRAKRRDDIRSATHD